jgi:hypothetical protein
LEGLCVRILTMHSATGHAFCHRPCILPPAMYSVTRYTHTRLILSSRTVSNHFLPPSSMHTSPFAKTGYFDGSCDRIKWNTSYDHSNWCRVDGNASKCTVIDSDDRFDLFEDALWIVCSVQFSSVQFSSVQFSSVQFSSVQFSSVQFSHMPHLA